MKKVGRRNFELAVVQKQDPRRLRTRTVETEPRKVQFVRSRRKQVHLRDMGNLDES